MSLRSGRIDLFDELRAAAQARAQRLEGEKMKIALMSDLHRHLQKIVKRVLDNADDNAPNSSTSELEIKYYEVLIEFLETIKKHFRGTAVEEIPADSDRFKDIRTKINGDSDLKDKVKKMIGTGAQKIPGSSKPNDECINYLKLSVKNVNRDLTAANKRKGQLEKEDNSETYLKAIEELKEARKKLQAAQMEIKWIKRDTEENADRNAELAECKTKTKDDGEDDIRKHYKKLGNTQKIYADCTTSAIDTLIDIYRAVDNETQNKIISPQSKKVVQKIQEVNGIDLVKEAKAEIDELTKSNEKQFGKG